VPIPQYEYTFSAKNARRKQVSAGRQPIRDFADRIRPAPPQGSLTAIVLSPPELAWLHFFRRQGIPEPATLALGGLALIRRRR